VALTTFFIFSLKIPWIGGSVYSGTENICTLRECSCINTSVECSCSPESSFQESFTFRDDSHKLQKLTIQNCSKIIFPSQAISAGSSLTQIHIHNVKQVEFQPESLSVSRLQLLNVSAANTVVFHQQSFKSFNTDSPVVSVLVSGATKVTVRPKAFASIKSLEVDDVVDLQLEPLALKLKIPTLEPTITIRLRNISTKSLSSSVFSSSFNSIIIQDSSIDHIQTGAFSGFLMGLVALRRVNINRIERAAFSDQSVIETLVVESCNISSLSQKAIVAGISEFNLTGSTIQSIAKYGAVNVTVANVHIINNTFRTLGEESFNFISWNSVLLAHNTIHFMEEGAINAIHRPNDPSTASFEFTNNRIGYANRNSLVTRLPVGMEVVVDANKFHHLCDCNQELYVYPLTGHSGLTSPFQDLSAGLLNTSYCRVHEKEEACFPSLAPFLLDAALPPATFAGILEYAGTVCQVETAPGCLSDQGEFIRRNSFYEDFLVLFQVKTTKGILLFLLVVVLACLSVLTICIGAIWVHRLCVRARMVRDKFSGSFQFNSGEEKQILFSCSHISNNTSTSRDTEPQYAEIAEIHPTPRSSDDSMTDLEVTTLTDVTTLPQSTTTTLPSLHDTTLPHTTTIHSNPLSSDTLPLHSERDKLLPSVRDSIRYSMSETSLTDEIMMALRDKLNDPSLYCTVMDAKGAGPAPKGDHKEEDLYCAPIYSNPNQLT